MPLSLPAERSDTRSLTDLLPELIRSLDAAPGWFPPAAGAVLVVVDGLGAANLTARTGHARALAALGGRRAVARTVFPSTTAAALTSLMTGVGPGQHGLVGYRVRVPGTDEAPNQLRGWETDGLDPATWQRAQPLFERESATGRPCFVVSKPDYTDSGFTRATLRGARFHPAEKVGVRAELAVALVAEHPGALVYVYAPELDQIAHRVGWESDAWAHALEEVDAAVALLDRSLPPGVGGVLTADHGMIDVPRHRQVLLGGADGLLDGVRIVGGEPRMLHLYTEDGAADAVMARWRAVEGHRSWVLSRAESLRAGLWGEQVDAAVLPRIGDVLVAPRAAIAYYDDRVADKGPQKMVGQHGSLTREETVVPLIGLGAWRRPGA